MTVTVSQIEFSSMIDTGLPGLVGLLGMHVIKPRSYRLEENETRRGARLLFRFRLLEDIGYRRVKLGRENPDRA